VSTCSGIGGLELGVRLVVPGLRVIAYVERDVPAAAVLARRMDDGALDAAPIWSDVTRFDGERWAGSVDIVMGGIPCQPFSVAGQRKGRDDERWIWPDIWRWVRAVRPAIVFLENVPGFIRHGLPVVLDDQYGDGAWEFEGEMQFWMAEHCPVHGFTLKVGNDEQIRGKHVGPGGAVTGRVET
jgi:DNA (cytosine-5)-methyltransferase 1